MGMPKRVRNSRSSSSFSFFCWCVMLLALAGLAQAVALDRLGQDDGGASPWFTAALVGGVDLVGIVAAARQLLELLVGEVLDQLEQLGVLAEEVLADVGAGMTTYFWYSPSTTSPMRLTSRPSLSRASSVPVAAPDDLDDVPAGAAEGRLEFLDDLAVAAHRAVEALQVAVDDEDQVVELLARGQRDGAERLGLVGLAVAEERPDLCCPRCP